MKKSDKKGLSAVIATFLIILLSLAAIAIVWVVIRNLVTEGTEGISFDRFTLNMDIEAAYIDGQNVNVDVSRGAGGGTLTGVYFIFHNGTSSTSVQRPGLTELEQRLFTFTSQEVGGINTVELVSVAPVYGTNNTEEVGDIVDTAEIQNLTGGSGGGSGGSVCGDGILSSGEQCDDGDTSNGDGCSSICTIETPSSCNSNNQVDSGELCDGTDLNGQSCQSFGFSGGTLGCTSCAFDTSQCTSSGGFCGDGVVGSGEQCDGSNLNGQQCTDLGFSGGTLNCNSQCQFDSSQCTSSGGPVCGNSICETGEDPISCIQDCPVPNSCNGIWDPQDVADGNECDNPSDLNCISCTCVQGYQPDGVGSCVPEPSLNSGTVDSVWPLSAEKYFDSNDLPKSSLTMASYIGKYVNFSGVGADTRCLRISYAEYISDPSYDKSYVRVELVANISAGNIYEIWNGSTCGA